MKSRKYLSDPTEDVRVATENLLADFLREIRDVTVVSQQLRQQGKTQTETESARRPDGDGERLPDLTLENAERALYMLENDEHSVHSGPRPGGEDAFDVEGRETGGKLVHYCKEYLF